MDWLNIVTTLLFISIVLNAGVYSFGLVDLGHNSVTTALSFDPNLPSDPNNFTSTDTNTFVNSSLNTSNNCNFVIPVIGTNINLPYLCQAQKISSTILTFISEFPWFFSDVLAQAQFPTPIVLFIGLIFMFVDYGALLYFFLLVLRSLTGGA